jgi:AraC-like DNA-binding protein
MRSKTMPRRTVHSPVLDFEPASQAPLRLAVTPFDGSHPGIRQPPHSHRFFEIIYVHAGEGVHRTGDVEAPAAPGDVFIVSPGETHDPRGLSNVQGYVLLFSAQAIDPRLTDADLAFVEGSAAAVGAFRFLRSGAHGGQPLHVPAEERTAWQLRLESIAHELELRAAGYEELTRAELRILLLHCARLVTSPGQAPMDGSSLLIGEALRYIDDNYRRPITLADVAKAVKRSRAYLTDRMHRDTGQTVGAWITERRMAEARRLLLETDLDIARIAHSLTFLDGPYFRRLFKRIHGMPPGEWRSARRKEASRTGALSRAFPPASPEPSL